MPFTEQEYCIIHEALVSERIRIIKCIKELDEPCCSYYGGMIPEESAEYVAMMRKLFQKREARVAVLVAKVEKIIESEHHSET